MSELLKFIISQGEQFRRARLPSLYSDFTVQRYSNPDGFIANTTAWIAVLTKAARAGLLPSDGGGRDTLSVSTGEALLRSLETKEWGTPLALGTVIDEAVAQRNMILYQDFFTTKKSIYSRNWTIQPWWLFSWGLEQLGLLDSSKGAGLLPTAKFVILPNVEEAALKLVNEIGSRSNQIDRIYPISMFGAEAGKILQSHNRLTDSDLHIILKYLARDNPKIIFDAEIVKFKTAGDTSSTLSLQDKTIASIKALIADINVQVVKLSARISSLSESAQQAIDNKNRTSALAALRLKKLNETVLTQRSETLAQLEGVYGKIEQAADQVAIIRVMEASTEVLRGLHAQVGGTDRVEDIIEGLRDEMGKADEIGGAIQAGAQIDTVIDESGVDEELESLEKQANAREEEEGARQMQERLASITMGPKTKETEQEELEDNPPELSFGEGALDHLVEEGISG